MRMFIKKVNLKGIIKGVVHIAEIKANQSNQMKPS